MAQSAANSNKSQATFLKWFREDTFGRKILDIIEEVIIVVLLLGSIAVVHKVLNWWLGHDYKLLDKIPIRYIIDIGHGLALMRFLLEIVSGIIQIVRGFKTGVQGGK